jgi:hypothetical protein
VTTGSTLEYILTYGNIATTSSNTQLVFPLPVGTSFVSATDDGVEAAGEVIWNLGSLAGGEGGERRVVVQVNAAKGALLEVDSARLSGTDAGFVYHQVQAGRLTRVEDNDRPLLAIDVNPMPVTPDGQLDVELTVTNPGSSLLSNVELILRYPVYLKDLPVSLITTGGSSNTVSCTAGISCNTGELVVWNLGSLPPGGGMTVTMPPEVLIGAPDGTLIQFEAELRVDGLQQALASKTTRV